MTLQSKNLHAKSKTNSGFDYILLGAVIVLVAAGLTFVYSAGYYTAQKQTGNKYYYLFKQLTGAAIGAVLLVAAYFVPQKVLKKSALPLFCVSLVLLGLVFVPHIGIENYGAKRWIGIGGFSFQPSEIAKFAFVLFCAYYFDKNGDKSYKFWRFLPIIAAGGAVCLLIIAEPNMSVTVCVGIVMLIMLLLCGIKIKHFVLLLLPAVAAVPALIFAEPYRIKRLLAFIDPWASPKNEGYQLIQSLYALGGGGWFGVGLFNSRQKYSFLPFAESDFIFSVIGEETGLFGCLVVFALYLIVIWRGIRIAVNADNKFDTILAGGVTAVIGVQTAINFAVVTGLIPPTGIPLPFVSYGGTSLVVFMASVGLLFNAAKRKTSILEFGRF